MNDYERVARVIRYLDKHHTEQPDLAALAESAGLSQFHFHRLFSAWAAITPKDFLQCLTLSHARAMLRAGEIVQEDEFGDGSAEGMVLRLASASKVRERPAGRRDLMDVPPSELLLVLERTSPRLAIGEDGEEEIMRRLLDHFGYTRLTTVRRRHLHRVLSLFRRRAE